MKKSSSNWRNVHRFKKSSSKLRSVHRIWKKKFIEFEKKFIDLKKVHQNWNAFIKVDLKTLCILEKDKINRKETEKEGKIKNTNKKEGKEKEKKNEILIHSEPETV